MAENSHNILILGAGLVSGPIVELLLKDAEYRVVLADIDVRNAEKLLKGHPHGKAVKLDIGNHTALQELINNADVVVSLVPYALHPTVAKACINAKVSLVTASYVSPAMGELDRAARDAGIILLNEIGLDPGIDHMSAMRIIHQIQKKGGTVTSFYSYCGGLPTPEDNNNPFGYKFSWSPKGVLLAGKNDAHYLKDGDQVDISGVALFQHNWEVSLPSGEVYQTYPNRDSLSYIKTYGLEGIQTMFRGTLRNANWCETMDVVKKLGFLADADADLGTTYSPRTLTAKISGLSESNLETEIVHKFRIGENGPEITALQWLGLFDATPREWRANTPIDCLTALMLEKMSYAPGERDMVVLHHEFEAEFPHGRKKYFSTLKDFGIPDGHTAMARTVTLPVGIAVKLIAGGQITATGVQIPVIPEIYEPVLTELEKLGVAFDEQEISID
ncbi:MAG: saccharopine dehydrogenase NADP-binding domain-containing protein [Candidatus Marinimicrobia bacterium]|nr:saccharopine dehydrogenase NADP-binding domain-containing protein [Candidatus Neomarinimicrobiota bacterium]MCF7840891.1 saccharopine dehydrogenase NADP-binding domain-containing protein [Candidatus Neomarinimicrobiota bacterium]